MSYLIDTDRVAEWLKGRAAAVQLLTNLATDGLAISLITYGEIYDGIYGGRDPQGQERGFRQLLRVVDVPGAAATITPRFPRTPVARRCS
jgi:predicted nucleic acid-binding protein